MKLTVSYILMEHWETFEAGCDRVVLILTKPVSIPREPGHDPFLARMIQRKYPVSAEKIRNRAQIYNESVELAKQYQNEGNVLILSPDDTAGVTTLSRNRQALDRLYQKGYHDAAAILERLCP